MASAPARAWRPCPHPGCRTLTQAGRCDLHKLAPRQAFEATRESASKRGYGRKWGYYREGWLRAHPLCGDRSEGSSAEHSACRRQGLNRHASVVDHIRPHRGDKALFWDNANHQSLCETCHNAKTAREVNARKAEAR
jgi:5-methylcytosine-specific restriction enzyme A